MKIRVIAVVLSVCLLLGVFPLSISAKSDELTDWIEEGYTLEYSTVENNIYVDELPNKLEIYSRIKQPGLAYYETSIVFRVYTGENEFVEYKSNANVFSFSSPENLGQIMLKDDDLGNLGYKFVYLCDTEYRLMVINKIAECRSMGMADEAILKSLSELGASAVANYYGDVGSLQSDMITNIGASVIDSATSILGDTVSSNIDNQADLDAEMGYKSDNNIITFIIEWITNLISEFIDQILGKEEEKSDEKESGQSIDYYRTFTENQSGSLIGKNMGNNVFEALERITEISFFKSAVVHPDGAQSFYHQKCDDARSEIINKILEIGE